ncbi:MAG: FAD-dependent oxidoreductase, partial [Planctomycetaceae bacterium]|nr:FAD-dependent oxidoreductase [Planctomycetaceae bacterium]
SVTPGSDLHRPDQTTEFSNLFLSGDWTCTGWPATMEGAVRSGYLAAEKILQQWGNPATICQSDLPRSRLTNWLGLLPSEKPG